MKMTQYAEKISATVRLQLEHRQKCNWDLENDVFMCVLSRVTNWRLWFLSWTNALVLRHLSWCHIGRKNSCCFLTSHSGEIHFISMFFIICCWLNVMVKIHAEIHKTCIFSFCWNLPLRTCYSQPTKPVSVCTHTQTQQQCLFSSSILLEVQVTQLFHVALCSRPRSTALLCFSPRCAHVSLLWTRVI